MHIDSPLAGTARRLTVVAPVHNEAENVTELVRRIDEAVALVGDRWQLEILLVDDGSTDDTVARVEALRAAGRPVGYLQLSRNFGHQAALAAGIGEASGDVVITLDGDLQHPPEEIPRMLQAFDDGADVVQMVREELAGRSKGLFSRVFYWTFNRISDTQLVPDASDFRLLSRRVVDVIVRIPEREKFLRGLIPSLGFRQVQLRFREAARTRGTPSFTFRASLRLAGRALFGHSSAPLAAVFYAGTFLSITSFMAGMAHVVKKLLYWNQVAAGFTDIIAAVVFLGGCILMAIGVVGHYQRIILEELRGRPAWIVRRHVPPAHHATDAIEPRKALRTVATRE